MTDMKEVLAGFVDLINERVSAKDAALVEQTKHVTEVRRELAGHFDEIVRQRDASDAQARGVRALYEENMKQLNEAQEQITALKAAASTEAISAESKVYEVLAKIRALTSARVAAGALADSTLIAIWELLQTV
jgi:uncharacterized coiled-coil DUF342 family protein